MLTKEESAELRQFFAIRSDLAKAVRFAVEEDVKHHLDELGIMQMHTTNERLRRACQAALAFPVPHKEAANA